MENHKTAVSHLSNQISKFHTHNVPFRIYHGNTNSTRPSSHTHTNSVDTSSLTNILSINTSKQTCLVEPNVPMDQLITSTLVHNLIPPVVPEFPGITVGGAFSGTAGESSSFKHGFFDTAVSWIEIILADGDVVTASEHEREDLFHGAKGTFGTLGVLTLLEIRLIRAKRFVELEYISVDGLLDAQKVMENIAKDEAVGFIDGIMYDKQKGVVMVGKMVDREEVQEAAQVVTFSKPWDEWFYLHAEKRMSEATEARSARDLIPLEEYIFRYDRGAFWTGRYAFSWFWTPFNRLTRWMLDGLMHTRVMYHALHRSGMIQMFIIQDMAVPWENAEVFSDWLDEELGIYPRWLCPLQQSETISMHPYSSAGADQKNLLNIGVWGPCPRNAVGVNRSIEAKLRSLRGMKWLYAQTFYTEDEFWNIYDKQWYDELREKYKAMSLPNVYDKVKFKMDSSNDISKGIWSVWPLAGLYGVASALKGGDYLRKR